MARGFNLLADGLQSEDRLRQQFAASVAHELRLAVLRSQVEAVQDGIAQADPQTLTSLHEQILRTGRLVDDLETLASAQAAGFTLLHQPVALRPLLEHAVDELSGLLAARQIRVETRLADLVVVGDSTRLRQVAANLLSNALKFTPAGGSVHVDLIGEEGQAVLRVADSGPGIPPEELPRVFDRFFRGSVVRAGGSGIGLAVVRELVAAHGGSVEAQSPGAGAVRPCGCGPHGSQRCWRSWCSPLPAGSPTRRTGRRQRPCPSSRAPPRRLHGRHAIACTTSAAMQQMRAELPAQTRQRHDAMHEQMQQTAGQMSGGGMMSGGYQASAQR